MISTDIHDRSLTHSRDLESQMPHSNSKSPGVPIARRYYKVITCAVGITVILVTLLGCGITHQDRRRLVHNVGDNVQAKIKTGWVPAVVTAKNEDGTYEVKFVDRNTVGRKWRKENVRLQSALSSPSNPRTVKRKEDAKSNVRINQEVLVVEVPNKNAEVEAPVGIGESVATEKPVTEVLGALYNSGDFIQKFCFATGRSTSFHPKVTLERVAKGILGYI